MKSLKYTFRVDSMKREVGTWSSKECEEYIDKHKNDEEPRLSQVKKVSVVEDILRRRNAAKNAKGEQRYKLLKGIKAESLADIAPKSALDPAGVKFPRGQENTGLHLFKRGENPDEFLGKGASKVVWRCGDKAVMVACNRNYGPYKYQSAASEVEKAKLLEGIVLSTKDPKWTKYISGSVSKGKEKVGKKAIIESEVAKGDWQKITPKGIGEILRIATNVLKALKIINDAGYSHNDIKPDNLFVVTKVSKSTFEEKNVTKLADFGLMSPFDKPSFNGPLKFRAPDYLSSAMNPEAVAKRDVYGLGFTLLTILVRPDAIKYSDLTATDGPEKVYEKYKLASRYGSEPKENVIKFLELLRDMVQPSHSKRISVGEALQRVRTLRGK